MSADQDKGLRVGRTSRAYGGYGSIFKPYKALKAGIQHVTCSLRCYAGVNNVWNKQLVSEFDPTKGGYVAICKKLGGIAVDAENSNGSWVQLPMHCYDLNFYIGNKDWDDFSTFPAKSTEQCDNINSRMWVMGIKDGKPHWRVGHIPAGTTNWDQWHNECNNVRWFIDNPKNSIAKTSQNIRMYRKGIDLDLMLYGTAKQATTFDIRVIRITDPRMCPDFDGDLKDDPTSSSTDLQDFHQNWQNMITPYVVNPLLKNEPGPVSRRWFETVAKKRVTVGERSNIETLPCVRTSLRVNLNKVYNYAWSNKNFNLQTGINMFDGALPQDGADMGANEAFVHKPYYTSRFYLLIRAMCPLDTTTTADNQDDNTDDPAVGINNRLFDDRGHAPAVTSWIPTYDLMAKTKWALVRNG